MSKEISKWADDFMFKAEESDAVKGPQAFLIAATPDPLGSIAVAAEAYMGRFYEDKSSITDEQRRYYLAEMQKTKLKMPMEAVSLHWRLKGVTRSFTHQMVRQRTAAYSQESMRFAVKEDAATAVALPPSLQGFNAPSADGGTVGDVMWENFGGVEGTMKWWKGDERSPADARIRKYMIWRTLVEIMGDGYNWLVEDGMPAEEARGLTPHNIVTQLNYITNLRNYQDHAGNRLCTQAQFEWRTVWTAMLMAMREYCSDPACMNMQRRGHVLGKDHERITDWCDNWQWVEIANLFRPVCYYTGQCQFLAEFDRKCNIRERVMANAKIGRPSSEWSEEYEGDLSSERTGPQDGSVGYGEAGQPVFIGAIEPSEWLLNDAAAR